LASLRCSLTIFHCSLVNCRLSILAKVYTPAAAACPAIPYI